MYKWFLIPVFVLLFLLTVTVHENPLSAQSFKIAENDEERIELSDKQNRKGFIRLFREMRSGEKGFFGFVKWIFSREKWHDIYRYLRALTGISLEPDGLDSLEFSCRGSAAEIDVDEEVPLKICFHNYEKDSGSQLAAYRPQYACGAS